MSIRRGQVRSVCALQLIPENLSAWLQCGVGGNADSPPPQRRHRARSFPVPRGRTATGGCFVKLALSATHRKDQISRMITDACVITPPAPHTVITASLL